MQLLTAPRPGAQNTAARLPASIALEDNSGIATEWKAFVRYHVSNEFFQEFARLMGPEIKGVYPGLEERIGRRLETFDAGMRFDAATEGGHVALDCQICINTPVTRYSSVRGIHTDGPDELYAMLLYFRRPAEDAVVGGDLDIYRWKDGAARRFVNRSAVDESDVERVDTIPYRPNTMVIFINSAEALHAVTPRQPTGVSRRLINIIGRVPHSVPEGLFKRPQKRPIRSFLHALATRLPLTRAHKAMAMNGQPRRK